MPVIRFVGRVLTLILEGLLLVLKTFFVLLMLVIPFPILLKPEITNAYRRNQITQVEKQKPPG